MTDTRPTIPPEDGKRYEMRCGKVTDILHPNGDWLSSRAFISSCGYSWRRDGTLFNFPHPNDLIAEYTGNAEPWTVPDDVELKSNTVRTDFGTHEQVIDYILNHMNDTLQTFEFILAWSEGVVAEEWPEYLEWLDARKGGA